MNHPNHLDLEDYLRTRKAWVDRALSRWLKEYPGHTHAVWKAMRYGLFPGGKRIRPILTLATGELFGARPKVLLPFACAVEMIHAYSIIHDDLPALDDDDIRRGEPAAHKVFGEGVALLAGDGLLTAAFHILSSPEVRRALPPELVLNLIHELGHAAGVAGLVGGQAFDLEAENREVDLATVEWIHVRKTGALILASVRLGAQVAMARGADLRRVSRFGEYLGLAFQIADDIVDAGGQGGAAGKRLESGRTERKKATYPSVVGIAQAKERLRELLRNCIRELEPFGEAAAALRGIARRIVEPAVQ
ncbi:MAG TPA: farnesyl diphosphate synthase [candidate division Zixibacteria bacterium]|nr:farnesyl diphosphate synthase [candidate division Zixibacteria bacterium]